MRTRLKLQKIVMFFVGMPLFFLACNITGNATEGVSADEGGSITSSPNLSQPQNTAESPPTPTETALVETQTLTPTTTIVHLTTPPGATGTTRYITDVKTKDYAPQKKAPSGWDVYQNNRYERPFTSETMDYLSDVDLVRVELKIASPWVYLTFEFVEPRAEGIGQTMYGAEFDVNKDDRGEFLVWGASPPSADWTTNGVEVWQDTNYDVGWTNPQITNAPWLNGDGYDKNLVASGVGGDPDLAWARQIEGGKKVQLAFKYTVLGFATQFLWNGLADAGVRNPAWFDYNDHFTQAEAGSPLPVQTDYYPLKALWGLDNTCRDAYGFSPAGTEAGLCIYTGTISGKVFRDKYYGNPAATIDNGILDANEPAYPNGVVHLKQGACVSADIQTATIGASGEYSFAGIPIGTYCVFYTYVDPWAWQTTPNPVPETLTADEHRVINFGVDWIDPPE